MTDAEIKDAIWSLSPEEATQILEARATDFRRAPAPLVPTNATEALQRRAELSADPTFVKAYLEGSIDARQQMDVLNEMIAGASDTDALTGEQVEVTDGTRMQLTRRQLISAAADMRAEGVFNEEGIALILNDGKFPTEDVYAAQHWLAQLERDETLWYPDLGGSRDQQLRFLRSIVAIGDGSRP
jgi:hypothetical protein